MTSYRRPGRRHRGPARRPDDRASRHPPRPGGAGKTRVVRRRSRRRRRGPGAGRRVAGRAGPVDDPGAVPEAVLTALGARETVRSTAPAPRRCGPSPCPRPAGHRRGAPRRALRPAPHADRPRQLRDVVDAAARLTEELLARCPDLTVLATSRERPSKYRGVAASGGAAARAGRPASRSPTGCRRPPRLPHRRDQDDRPPAPRSAAASTDCRWPSNWPPPGSACSPRARSPTAFDDRFRLLTSGNRTVLPRQQTPARGRRLVLGLLDAEERDVLGRLAMLRGRLRPRQAPPRPSRARRPGRSWAPSSTSPWSSPHRPPATACATGSWRPSPSTPGNASTRPAACAAAERAHLTYYRELARTTDPLLRGRAAVLRHRAAGAPQYEVS
ncbi:hypothetical protein LV779_19475 [Streptomyces thinghirensis]|nr:hypothetical protein [Streptomyces thinghirensis]